jgi:hypothetical protein
VFTAVAMNTCDYLTSGGNYALKSATPLSAFSSDTIDLRHCFSQRLALNAAAPPSTASSSDLYGDLEERQLIKSKGLICFTDGSSTSYKFYNGNDEHHHAASSSESNHNRQKGISKNNSNDPNNKNCKSGKQQKASNHHQHHNYYNQNNLSNAANSNNKEKINDTNSTPSLSNSGYIQNAKYVHKQYDESGFFSVSCFCFWVLL